MSEPLDERFAVQEGALVRRVHPRRGTPYEHRCQRESYEEVAHTIDELESERFTLEELQARTKLPFAEELQKSRRSRLDLQLTGKRALVTGSSSGIGQSIGAVLAKEGATVVLHGRDKQRTEAAAKAIRAEGGRIHIALGDLATDEGAASVAAATRSALGSAPDILVNNAGGFDGEPQDWRSASIADWHVLFEQNLFSAVRLIHAFSKEMRAKGWGRIINIGTNLSTAPGTFLPHYAAAKAALINTTVSLAQELAGTGVTVNTLSPGPIVTPAFERVARGMAAQGNWGTDDWDQIEKRFSRDVLPTMVGRAGRIEEVAAAAAFLASPLAGFITAAHLRVDGGAVKSIS